MTMFYDDFAHNKIMLVQKMLDKEGFSYLKMCKEEKCAIKRFIETLANPKKYKAHWITKEGDNYVYKSDKTPQMEEYKKGYEVEIEVSALFSEYIFQEWGDDAISLLRVISLEGMKYIHEKLSHLTINIINMTHKHKALIFKLHKIKVEEKIAIDKIKRNRIYNMGLGLKLAVKEYNKDF